MKNLRNLFISSICLLGAFIPVTGLAQLLQQNPTPPIGIMMVKDAKSGTYHENGEEKINIIGYSNLIRVNTSNQAGNASTRKIPSPIIIVKEWGESSPLFYQALTTNQLLDIRLEFYSSRNITGINTTYQIIHLTNARIVQISSTGGAYSADKAVVSGKIKEEISITYEKISYESPNGKTAANDDWIINH